MLGDVGPGAGAAQAAPPGGNGTTANGAGSSSTADLAEMDAFALASAAFAEGEPADQGAGNGAGEASTTTGDPGRQAATGDQQATTGSDGQQQQQQAGTEPSEIERLRAENERLKAGQQAGEPAPPKEVGDLRRFVGLDPVHEGGPTLDQLERLITARDYAGLNKLKHADGSEGFTLEEALDLKRDLEGRQQIIQSSTGLFHGMAWGAIGSAFDEQVQALGLDPKAVAEEAAKGGNPLGTSKVYLSKIVEAAKKAGREEGAREWKGRHDGLRNEFDAFKASAAGGASALESGGRGNGSRGAAAVLALSDDEFVERATRGDFAGLDLRDPS